MGVRITIRIERIACWMWKKWAPLVGNDKNPSVTETNNDSAQTHINVAKRHVTWMADVKPPAETTTYRQKERELDWQTVRRKIRRSSKAVKN